MEASHADNGNGLNGNGSNGCIRYSVRELFDQLHAKLDKQTEQIESIKVTIASACISKEECNRRTNLTRGIFYGAATLVIGAMVFLFKTIFSHLTTGGGNG